jgi:tetratricopeptide (TPR) repeat protein
VIHSFRAEGAFKVTTAIGFTGFILALILLNSILVSLSEPARVLLMGVGLLFVGRVCASKHKRPGARMSTVTHVTSLVCLIWLASVLSTSCAKNPEVAKRAYLESGDGYFAQKKYHEAIVQYRNAVQQDARFGEARYKLAEAYVRINDPAGAYREYIRAADLMPTNVESQLKAGQMLLLGRQFEDAKARADRILANDPKNVQAQILRGSALAGLKDLDSAIAQIEEAIQLDPERSSTYDNLGALRLAKGNREGAEDAFRKAVEINGKSVTARLALATFYLSTKRAAEAERALLETRQLDAANPTANRVLALFYLASHRAPEAEPYLKTFAGVAKTAASQLALADYYTLMNRSSDAVRVLTAIAVEDTQAFAGAQSRIAAIEYARGQKAGAHTRLNDLLTRQPKYLAGLLLKGRFLLVEQQRDGALAQAKAATQADPMSAQAQFFLGKVYAASNQLGEAAQAFTEVLKLNPRATAAQIELSRVQLAVGNVDASVASAREVLKSQPDNPDARLLAARGRIALRELAPAETEMKALVAKYPNVSAVHSQIGVLYLAKGDPLAARRSFERALTLDAGSLEALSGLVRLDLTAKHTTEARARVEAKLTQAPNDARLLLLAASTYAETGDPVRAEQMLQHAIEIDAANIQAHAMLGQLFMSEQKLEQAKAAFDVVSKLHPQSNDAIAARTMVALILSAQKRLAEAQNQYEQILATSPRSVVAANNLAWLYAERGNLDVALELAQTAAQQAPEQPAINDTLGWIYYKKNLLGQAIAALQRSVEKDPINPIYHYHLGLAYTKGGELARAKQSLEKALMLKPYFDGYSDARSVLASIRR